MTNQKENPIHSPDCNMVKHQGMGCAVMHAPGSECDFNSCTCSSKVLPRPSTGREEVYMYRNPKGEGNSTYLEIDDRSKNFTFTIGDIDGNSKLDTENRAEKKHYSDCAVHNEPAEPKGECNCGGFKSTDWQEDERKALEEIIKSAIVNTYPDDIWLPVPKELRAKDGVAAQLLRDMAPALASIAFQAIEPRMSLAVERARKEAELQGYIKGKRVRQSEQRAFQNGRQEERSRLVALAKETKEAIRKLPSPDIPQTKNVSQNLIIASQVNRMSAMDLIDDFITRASKEE